jgi:VanZ family protein
MSRKWKVFAAWLLVVLWMALIFRLSAQPANQSEKLSMNVTQKVVETVQMITNTPDSNMDDLDHIVRKCAHFSAYLVLGLLTLNAFGVSGQRGGKRLLLTMLVCVLYASSDETHQIFVSGRGPKVTDVLIDSTGSLIGLCGYLLLRRKRGR